MYGAPTVGQAFSWTMGGHVFLGNLLMLRCLILSVFAFTLTATTSLARGDYRDTTFREASFADEGRYALIAGGSKGIGYAIAEALAKRGYNLVLIARHLEGLENARDKLQEKYHVTVHILVFDLTWKNTAEDIAKWCKARKLRLEVLCNVAGLGGDRDFLSYPLDSLRYMVDLNIESCMALTLTLLPLLEKNSPSYVLNVASMAGFAPIPEKNIYAATKSAVIFFSYALRYQLRDKDISVSCLAPGPVFTKTRIIKETQENLGWIGMQMAVPPARVGEVAVRRMLRGRLMIVPGTLASVAAFLVRLLPRRVITALYYRAGKR